MSVRNTIGVDLGFSAKRLNHHLRLGEAVHDRGDFFFFSLTWSRDLLLSTKTGRITNSVRNNEGKNFLTQRHLPAIDRKLSSDRGIFLEGPF
jgi:hypothetical protein